ncbi:MAG: DUF4433 domain-containing protein [Chloroflexi bacterium]|nr:DUF4433 domain-containing protein [Chloroflexota bacterium]
MAEVWVGRLLPPQLITAIGVPDDDWATRVQREARRLNRPRVHSIPDGSGSTAGGGLWSM